MLPLGKWLLIIVSDILTEYLSASINHSLDFDTLKICTYSNEVVLIQIYGKGAFFTERFAE